MEVRDIFVVVCREPVEAYYNMDDAVEFCLRFMQRHPGPWTETLTHTWICQDQGLYIKRMMVQ